MEFLFIFIAIAIIGILLFKMQNKMQVNPKKKEEILQGYEAELTSLLSKASTVEEKTKIKTQFLQKCNSELSRNIFFDENEAKVALKKLASL